MAESLRDQLAANLDVIETQETPAPVEQTPAAEAPAAETQVESKPGRTAGRERDEQGRLKPGPAKRPETSVAELGKAPPAQNNTAQAIQAAPAAEPKARPKYPSTWKRDYQQLWDKAPDDLLPLLEYVGIQREGEYAKGVSTYKGEWENARPLMEAIAPFKPYLEQNKIDPSQWITNLGNAHKTLVYASPQDRLATFAKLARDYQVPLEQMFVRGQDGQVYFNQQLLQQAAPQQQPQQRPEDVRKMVTDLLSEERANREIADFAANTEEYPHFASVKPTMVGLLQSGLVSDLASAYKAAIRMPQHSELYEAQQKLERDADEKRKQEEKRQQVEAAKRNAVSTRTATPTAQPSSGTAKGLRAQLAANLDAIEANRV